jgi:hypothetical protein
MSEMAIGYKRRPVCVADFHRMDEVGTFDPDERLELPDGEIILVLPMGPRHAGAIGRMDTPFDLPEDRARRRSNGQ